MNESDETESLLNALADGQLAPAARLITRIERADPTVTPLLTQLYSRGRNSLQLGITGPPGAGKSTLINQLISAYRHQHKRVAVLAVDPSSPFSGGAILGDRVRMNQHATDPDVFIRSMASRGQLGGLAKSTGDALTVLDAMNFDVIIIETVGVGQSEIDILRHAQCVLLLQTPESGDRIQAVKAGLMEIGDIYIVNKADHEGAAAMARGITEMLHFQTTKAEADAWLPPVVETEAVNGKGVDQLLASIEQYHQHLKRHPDQALQRDMQRLRHRLMDICQQLTRQQLFSPSTDHAELEQSLEQVAKRLADPYSLAEQMVRLK